MRADQNCARLESVAVVSRGSLHARRAPNLSTPPISSSAAANSSALVEQLASVIASKSAHLLGSLKQHSLLATMQSSLAPGSPPAASSSSSSSSPSGPGEEKQRGQPTRAGPGRQQIQRSATSNSNLEHHSQALNQVRSSGGANGSASDQMHSTSSGPLGSQSTAACERLAGDAKLVTRSDSHDPTVGTPKKPPLPPPPPRELVQACVARQTSASGGGPTSSLGSPQPTSSSIRRHALQEHSLERDAALSFRSVYAKELKHKRASSIRSALRHAHLATLRAPSISKRALAATAAAQAKSESAGRQAPKSNPYELFEPPVTQRTFERSKRRRGAMLADPRRQMSADTIGLRQLTDEYLQNAGVQQFVAPAAAAPDGAGPHSSLVALGGPLASQQAALAKPGTIAVPGGSSTVAAIAAATSGSPGAGQSAASSQAQCALEAQLYQAARQASARLEHQATVGGDRAAAAGTDSSSLAQDSLAGSNTDGANSRCEDTDFRSQVTNLPGALPWQCDVSIQCELLQAPPMVEPYETTGDILNTIARPFRGPPLSTYSTASFESSHAHHHHAPHHHHHLSATLKRGLSAISQHHLSPVSAAVSTASAGSMALNVVGSLKKSISNTFDPKAQASGVHGPATGQTLAASLRSQDSLPAYSNLLNEPDEDDDAHDNDARERDGPNSCSLQEVDKAASSCGSQLQTGEAAQTGLIGQLASRLTRQSSRKLGAGKRELQRALSFDYRGYKRFEGRQQPAKEQGHKTRLANSAALQTSADSTASSNGSTSGPSNLMAARSRQHNKSTLGLQSLRPYLPQSASQVDFQVPLLPYERMQEAIVSQRLLEPAQSGSPADELQKAAAASQPQPQQPVDVDELICGQPPAESLTSPSSSSASCASAGQQPTTSDATGPSSPQRQRQRQPPAQPGGRRREPSPRLVLNISAFPSTPRREDAHNEAPEARGAEQDAATVISSPNVIVESELAASSAETGQSPGAAAANLLAGAATGQMSQSPSFCIDPGGRSASLKIHGPNGAPVTPVEINSLGPNLLTASDVFNKSKNFIKRPSTMMAGDDGEDALNQVVQALESKAAQCRQQQQLSSSQSVRSRDRRQAIVPPKLATDACSSSDSEPCETGQLVDLADDVADEEKHFGLQADHDGQQDDARARRTGGARKRTGRRKGDDEFGEDEEEALSAIRRKRSGGGIEKTSTMRAPDSSGKQDLPTVHIEPDERATTPESAGHQQQQRLEDGQRQQRPDSQATNADSIASSGSSTTLSALASGRLSASAGLSVPFASGSGSSSRRRSSIAVIPQMQICPGDLLVYSKQLIERMNQSDENEPPQFLTIDDKKSKNNIWASFKLCAQFDSRTLRARNELLCSLEDVLASLQPSTFVDEQLSHYKGMLWSEFLYETESRRSASSEGPNADEDALESSANTKPTDAKKSYRDDLADVQIGGLLESCPASGKPDVQQTRSGSMRSDELKDTSSSASPAKVCAPQAPGGRAFASRLREKPKLKRGQTVDSVFRIPLIPSSPLKHAQQHQQTPTAHLEDYGLNTIEDDEHSSMGSATSGGGGQRAPVAEWPTPSGVARERRKRSSSTRSRSASRPNHLASGSGAAQGSDGEGGLPRTAAAGSSKSQDSSFDAEDAHDLLDGTPTGSARRARPPQGQMPRQSSLSTLSSTVTRTEQKRQHALWDLFQSECTFFFDHLMTLKNVYMEPLKKIQVEGFAMFADPDVLFGNLDELCCDVYDFCKEFLYIIMRTLKTRPEELNATDVLIKLYKKNPKIDHLRAVYHRYTLNYINALTYLESLRRQVEFVEFEKWSSRDVRCKKLQLTDLLVAPVQHIMRVPIILKDIEAHTENLRDRDEIRAILAVEEASLRELDDKMRWLKNFERLLEIQKNISWPSVLDMDAKLYVPEFLKEVLSKQPCEKLIVSPRRQIVHEGTLSNLDSGGKATDMHVILFDDMLLMTRRKKALTKKSSTVCKTNSAGHHCAGGGSGGGAGGVSSVVSATTSSMLRDDGSYKYVVYKQPLSLDRFYVHDVQQTDSQSVGVKHLFLLIVMNRFQQITTVHSFATPNDDMKQTWLFKIKKTVERWKRNYSTSSGATGEQQSAQQQQISSSKSMPIDSPDGQKRASQLSSRPAPGTSPRQHANSQPLAQHWAGKSTGRQVDQRTSEALQQEPSATVRYQSSQQAHYDSQQQIASSANKPQQDQHQQQRQPIEFVITSASESPASNQADARRCD